MKIIDLIKKKKTISFEFFPPKRESDLPKLYETVDRLSTYNPDFVSFTYGAGGNTRQLTIKVSKDTKIANLTQVMTHLTCVAHTKKEIDTILDELSKYKIENIIALRGDKPKDIDIKNELIHSTDLISYIKNKSNSFCIAAACYPELHPETNDFSEEIKYTKLKQDKGADFLVTQLFFDNKDYFKFVDESLNKGITIPIIPGILPIVSTSQIRRITKLCGSKIPNNLNIKLEKYKDNNLETAKLGIEYATKQVLELIENDVPGIHFYSLNKTKSVGHVLNNLGISTQTPEHII